MKGVRFEKRRAPGLATNTGVVDMICEGVKTGLTFEAAATIAGLTAGETRRLKKDAIDFSNNAPVTDDFDESYKALLRYLVVKITAARAEGEKEMLGLIKEAALSDPKYWKAALEWLRIMNPERYSPHRIIHTTGDPLSADSTKKMNFEEMSSEELLKLVEGEVIDAEAVSNSDDDVHNSTNEVLNTNE